MSEDEEQRPQADDAEAISSSAASESDPSAISAPAEPTETPAAEEATASEATASEPAADNATQADDDAVVASPLTTPAAPDKEQEPLLPGVPDTEAPEPQADALSAILGGAESAPAHDAPATPSTLTVLDARTDAEAGTLPAQPLSGAALGAPEASARPLMTFDWLDDRIPPLRLTPFQRPRKIKPLVWGGLAGAALLLVLPALLASILWPALGLASPFGGPPDHLPRGARAWVSATAITPLAADDANFGAQTYPVDARLAAGYAAHGGLATLGAAITPAFTCNLGLAQFFANGALLQASQGSAPQQAATSADHDLAPELARDGDLDATTDVEWLPLSHALLAGGSAALIGGAGSGLTYAKLRQATLPVELRAEPASVKQHIKPNAPLPQ
ncbi:MAG: hypothetical protein ACRDID_19075, partial [Ktedonobacterales bacterium]